jgi:hypothetical protein
MNQHTELFDFLCNLIDIQIKKYVSLATFGVGPDARLNAKLVCDEVNELLKFGEQLLTEIKRQTLPIANAHFINIFNQVKFYVEQEYIRAHAGWLLDENNIHTPVMGRVTEQLEQLNEIAKLAEIDSSTASKPVTVVQKQCKYDSCAIAFHILDLAKKIKYNPEMEVDTNIPLHARIILKRNATTRYCKEEFARPIDDLHEQYNAFLIHSDLAKSCSLLSKEVAKSHERGHRNEWNNLLNRYMNIHPTSKLFSPDHEWYKISSNSSSQVKSKSIFSSGNLMLFSGVVVVGGLFIYMLMSYFTQLQDEDSLKSVLKLD